MKAKRPDRVERRRPLVEINLLVDRVKERAAKRGCLPFSLLVLALGAAGVAMAGLHLI